METMIVFEAVLKIMLSMMMGSVCGMAIYFIDYTFWKGAIFDFYLPWLAKKLLKHFALKRYKDLIDLKGTMSEDDYDELAKNTAQDYVFFYKMLGGCPVCFGMWIAIISWTIISYFTILDWYYAPAYIFVSSWQVRKLVKATY